MRQPAAAVHGSQRLVEPLRHSLWCSGSQPRGLQQIATLSWQSRNAGSEACRQAPSPVFVASSALGGETDLAPDMWAEAEMDTNRVWLRLC